MQKKWFFISLLIIIVSLNSCESKKNATTTKEKKETESQHFEGIDILHNCEFVPPKDSKEQRIDTAASKIEWFVENHRGFLKFNTGSFYLKKDKIISGEFIANMNSITNTDIDYALMKGTLENTLKSEDFFKAKTFPEGHFHITNITNTSDSVYRVKGHMVLLNISHPITFDAIISFIDGKIVATSKPIIIDRTKWKIMMFSKKIATKEDDIIVSDDIKLVVHLETNS